MIVADSNVWIPFFRRDLTPHTRRLGRSVADGQVIVPDLVVAEVLQGCTSDRAFEEIRRALSVIPILTVANGELSVIAVRSYRALRALGITVRSTIDTLIATRCILDGHELLHADRDFDGFERHLGLKVVPASAVS